MREELTCPIPGVVSNSHRRLRTDTYTYGAVVA